MLERAFRRLLNIGNAGNANRNPTGNADTFHTNATTSEDAFAAAVRLSLGHFHGADVLGVGASTIRNAAAMSLGCSVDAVMESEAESRDLADGITNLHRRAMPRTVPTTSSFTTSTTDADTAVSATVPNDNRITILDIAEVVRKLAATSGTDSNAAKEALISDMLRRCFVSSEIRFFVRTLQGSNKLRIGMGESSIVGAAARAVLCAEHTAERAEQRQAEMLGRQMFMSRHDPDCFGSTLFAVAKCRRRKGTDAALRMCKTLSTPVVLTPARAMLASPGTSVSEAVGYFGAGKKATKKKKKEAEVGADVDNRNAVYVSTAMEKNVLCQYKYDGERALIHIVRATTNQHEHTVRVFSRVGEDTTPIYKHVAEKVAHALIDKENDTVLPFSSCILDGEIVPIDHITGDILPFQALRRRQQQPPSPPPPPATKATKATNATETEPRSGKRHGDGDDGGDDDDATAAADGSDDTFCDTAFIAFDLLEMGGDPLVDLPLRERKSLLSALVSKSTPGVLQICEDVEVRAGDEADLALVKRTMDKAVHKGCEGLVVKPLDGDKSLYRCGERTRSWLKLKKDYIVVPESDNSTLALDALTRVGAVDTVDLVPLAAYHGRGKRRGMYGSFLMGCRVGDTDNGFKTVCKVGTGFSGAMLREVTQDLEQCILNMPVAISGDAGEAERPPPHSVFQNAKVRPVPDVFFEPRYVWEIRAADVSLSKVHNAGLGLLGRGLSLRFPRFVRLRGDKSPSQATSEEELCDHYSKQNTRSLLRTSPNKALGQQCANVQ